MESRDTAVKDLTVPLGTKIQHRHVKLILSLSHEMILLSSGKVTLLLGALTCPRNESNR